MSPLQISKISTEAVNSTRKHYGPKVWDFINVETRKALVARTLVVNFGTLAPDAAARHIATALSMADDLIDRKLYKAAG